MSASDESEAETRRIIGSRKRKLRSSRQACTVRCPPVRPRYHPRRTGGAARRIPAVLEECTLRLGATHHPVRKDHKEESDYSLECARRGRHAYVSDGGERAVHVRIDDVSGRIELGCVASHLVK